MDPGEYPFPIFFFLLIASWIDGIVEEYINFEFVLAASQAGDADSSRAPGLTSGLQGPWMSIVVL